MRFSILISFIEREDFEVLLYLDLFHLTRPTLVTRIPIFEISKPQWINVSGIIIYIWAPVRNILNWCTAANTLTKDSVRMVYDLFDDRSWQEFRN